MNERAEKASTLLQHYFRLLAKDSNITWDSDNDAEINDVIEWIMSAVEAMIDEHGESPEAHSETLQPIESATDFAVKLWNTPK